jgi:hypothetical protein
MIAKVTASGAGAGGLIAYVYDGREEKRQRGDKKAEVILHSENLQMPRDAHDLAGRRAITKDFDSRAKLATADFKYMGMHVLSFTKDEMKTIDTAKMKNICAEYVEMAGLEKTQYFAVAHNDTDHFHVHFVFNRIDNKGHKMDSHYEKLKTTFRGVALSLNYGLKLKGESFKIGQSYKMAEMRHKHPTVLAIIHSDKTNLLKTSKSLKNLKYLAAKQGIKVTEYWSQQKELKQLGLKIGDLPKEEIVNFNRTKIGEAEYQNEDMRAIFYGNMAKAKSQAIENKADIRKLHEWNFDMEVPHVTYTQEKRQSSYRYIMDFGPLKRPEKHASNKLAKIAEYEIKIQKLQKLLGIKV